MRIINHLLNGLLPAQCLVCKKTSDVSGRCLCHDCEGFLAKPDIVCRRCGLALKNSHTEICGQCLKQPPVYDSSWSAWWYGPPVDRLILGAKYQRKLAAAELLGQLMAEKLQGSEREMPDALLPVPLHRNRLWQRGYNQAIELFRPVSRQLDIPMIIHGVQRSRSTPSQVGMHIRERKRNLKGAFRVTRPLPAHIAIVDDVSTTGTTVSELARALKKAGVKKVQVWSAARAEAP